MRGQKFKKYQHFYEAKKKSGDIYVTIAVNLLRCKNSLLLLKRKILLRVGDKKIVLLIEFTLLLHFILFIYTVILVFLH